jgi:hypothetical protein
MGLFDQESPLPGGNSNGARDKAVFFLAKVRRIAGRKYIATGEDNLNPSVAYLHLVLEEVKTELVNDGKENPVDCGGLCFVSWEIGCDTRVDRCRMTVSRPGTSTRR